MTSDEHKAASQCVADVSGTSNRQEAKAYVEKLILAVEGRASAEGYAAGFTAGHDAGRDTAIDDVLATLVALNVNGGITNDRGMNLVLDAVKALRRTP